MTGIFESQSKEVPSYITLSSPEDVMMSRRLGYIRQSATIAGRMNGQPYMRPAMVADCRMYPNLRLIITSSGLDKVMYDGTSFDWDSKMPVIQYTVDDWAWEALGRSLVGDVASIETTIRKHQRLMDQLLTAQMEPPLGYKGDENGGKSIETWDMFAPEVRLALFGGDEPRKTLQSLLPEGMAVGPEN